MNNGKAKAVSYEQFAPRSTDLRSKLAKIQSLTAGPIQAISTISHANDNSTATIDSSNDKSPFLNAMVPPGNSSTTGSNSISISNTNDTNTMSGANVNSNAIQGPEIAATLRKTTKTSNHISKILTTTSKLHATLLKTTSLAQSITNRHTSLLHHSSELSISAERLQNESDQLAQHATEIGLPLKHYDAVDRLGLQVGVLFKNGTVVKGLAKVKVDEGEFVAVLEDVDAAVNFFAERSEISTAQQQQQLQIQQNDRNANGSHKSDPASQEGSGSIEYYKRSLALQEACMDLFNEAIVYRIIQTSTQIHNALDLKRKSVGGDTLEASLIYTRFHGISSRSQYLLNTIKKRMGSTVLVPIVKLRRAGNRNDLVCPYTELWNMCRNTYIQNRLNLLNLSIRNHLDFLKEKHGLIGMTRLASVFLMRMCTAETALYLDFFGQDEEVEGRDSDEKEEGGAGKVNGTGAMNGDASGNMDQSRRSLMNAASRSSSTSISSSTLNVKKVKKDAATLASQVMAKDGTYYDAEFQAFLDNLCSNLHRTIRRGIVSIMELDTLCQVVSVLREERSLANASPTTMAAARSLGRVIVDAQERLIFCANGVLSKDVVRFKATPADLDYPDKLRKCKEQQDEKKEGATSNGGRTSASDDALKVQMQIYESWFPPIRSVLKVLSKIFRVVEPKVFEDIALSSVQSCARSLKEGSAYIEKRNGQLHSDLFLVKHLLILREQLSPFDIQLRSVERQLDFSDAGKAVSRFLANRNRRLFSMTTENALVTLLREGVHTREASIDSKRDLEDALRSACNDFIEHTAVSLAGPVITFVEQCKSIAATNASLTSQSFMTGDYVKAVVNRTLDRLEPQLGEVSTQMGLYMDNAATRGILLKPVIKKILRVLEESKKFIEECVSDENSSWEEGEKAEIFKCIGEIEIIIKTRAPRL